MAAFIPAGRPLIAGRGRARSGALGPALMIVLALLFLLGVLAMAQMQLSSQSLHVATWDAGGAIAESIAVSAIEEAAWRLDNLLTDHTAKEFLDLRFAILANKPVSSDLSKRLYPDHLVKQLVSAIDRPLYRAVRLERFSAVLHVPNAGQCVDFDATVTISVAGHTIYRRAVERRLYGATFLSPRNPFDRTTLAIVEHKGIPVLKSKVEELAAATQDVNRLINAVNSILPPPGSCASDCGPELPGATLPPLLVRLGKAPDLPSEPGGRVERLLQQNPSLKREVEALDPESRSWKLWSLAGLPNGMSIPIPSALCCTQPQLPQLDPVSPRLVFSQAPSTELVTATTLTVDLAKFDYEVRLRDEYGPFKKRLEEVLVPLNEALLQWMRSPPTSAGGRATLASMLHSAAKRLPDPLRDASKHLNAITRHADAHTRLEMPDDASVRPAGLSALAYHLESQKHFDEFRKSYPLFSGHLSYVGPSPLFVTLPRFTGRAVVSQEYLRPKPLVLREITTKNPARDLVLVHTDYLTLVDSEIHAGIWVGFHRRSRLFLDTEPRIRGNLGMWRLEPLAARTPTEELKGRIVYNPAIAASGPREGTAAEKLPKKMPEPGSEAWKRIISSHIAMDHVALALRPRGRARALFRSPGAFAAAKAEGAGK